MTTMEQERIYTALELAEFLRLTDKQGKPSAARVNALISAGFLPNAFRVNASRSGRSRGPKDWRIPASDVEAFRAQQRADVTPARAAVARAPGRPRRGAPKPARRWIGDL